MSMVTFLDFGEDRATSGGCAGSRVIFGTENIISNQPLMIKVQIFSLCVFYVNLVSLYVYEIL